jgi:uncharacterized protein (DUF427 family)
MRVDRVKPGPGQESVWDYPRPPRVEASDKRIRILFGGVQIADSRHALRVLETSHPPVYYIPMSDILPGCLQASSHATWCEWKGIAKYYAVSVAGKSVENAAWSYPQPTPAFEQLRNCIAFYPSKMDACFVEEEQVQTQAGDFYGGWITSHIVGPFKGGPGTAGW